MPNNSPKLSANTRVNIPTFWLILILVSVVVLAFYLYMTAFRSIEQPKPTNEAQDPQVRQLSDVSNSDEVSTIEQELNATDVEKLDQGAKEAVLGVQY